MSAKRLKPAAKVHETLDDGVVLDELLKEVQRGNPGWRASLPQAAQDALARRDARRK